MVTSALRPGRPGSTGRCFLASLAQRTGKYPSAFSACEITGQHRASQPSLRTLVKRSGSFHPSPFQLRPFSVLSLRHSTYPARMIQQGSSRGSQGAGAVHRETDSGESFGSGNTRDLEPAPCHHVAGPKPGGHQQKNRLGNRFSAHEPAKMTVAHTE